MRGLLAALVLAPLFCPSTTRAQAWLPPKGEASLSFGYGNAFVNRHYLGLGANSGDNVENDLGHIRSQSFGIGVSYGVTDRFAVSVGVPLIESKYYGTQTTFLPHDAHLDDGNYHSTLQDFTVNLAYQVLNGPVALSPFFVAVIPSHGYTTFAHTAAGKDLHEYWLGFSVGSRLDRLLPGSYVEATYSYAFVERVMDIHHDRSNVFLELGYFLTPSLSIRGIGTGFYTHGGFAFESPQQTPPELFLVHDQVGHDSGIHAGGGISYVLTGSTELFASYLTQVQGRGGHKVKDGVSFGVSWNFSPQQVVRRYFASTKASAAE